MDVYLFWGGSNFIYEIPYLIAKDGMNTDDTQATLSGFSNGDSWMMYCADHRAGCG